jgi:hypothetical protein
VRADGQVGDDEEAVYTEKPTDPSTQKLASGGVGSLVPSGEQTPTASAANRPIGAARKENRGTIRDLAAVRGVNFTIAAQRNTRRSAAPSTFIHKSMM